MTESVQGYNTIKREWLYNRTVKNNPKEKDQAEDTIPDTKPAHPSRGKTRRN